MKHTLYLLVLMCLTILMGCDINKDNENDSMINIPGYDFPVYVGHFADYVQTNENGNILGDIQYGKNGNTYDWELLEYHGKSGSNKGFIVDPCLSDLTYSNSIINGYSALASMSDKTKTPEEPIMPPLYINTSITPNYHVKISCYFYPGENAIGFNIYRSATCCLTDAVKINNTLLKCGDNSLEPFIYSYYDEYVILTHTYYYWLEKIDTSDGISYHGPVRATVIYDGSEPMFNKIYPAYPNPCTTDIALPYSLTEDSEMHILIINRDNEVVRSFSGSKSRGSERQCIDVSDLPTGLYRVFYWIIMQNRTYYSYGDVLKQ